MSSIIRDLWPDDIKSEEVISPEGILKHQASLLERKTGTRLVGHVVKHENEDRTVLGFEVEAPRVGNRIRLFEVHHRQDCVYPVAIVPPDETLPEFLRDRRYRPGFGGTTFPTLAAYAAAAKSISPSGEWVENEWIASSPTEFSDKVGDLLARPVVKGIVLSLLAQSSDEGAPSSREDGPA